MLRTSDIAISSSSLPYISSTVRRRHDFPAGDIESRRIFAGTVEIGVGNASSTMFTQTRRGENDPPAFGVYVLARVLTEFCTERNLPLVYISIDPRELRLLCECGKSSTALGNRSYRG